MDWVASSESSDNRVWVLDQRGRADETASPLISRGSPLLAEPGGFNGRLAFGERDPSSELSFLEPIRGEHAPLKLDAPAPGAQQLGDHDDVVPVVQDLVEADLEFLPLGVNEVRPFLDRLWTPVEALDAG